LREDCGVLAHEFNGFCRPRAVIDTTAEHDGIVGSKVRDLVDRANIDSVAICADLGGNPVRNVSC